MGSGVSRRGFLKWAVAVAAIAGVAAGAGLAISTKRTPTPTPTKTAPTPSPAKTITPRTMKISHQWSTTDVRHIWAVKFAQMVEERTGGELKFTIYPAQSLYKAAEQWDYIVSGDLEFTIIPLDYASGKVPQISVTLMPATITSLEQAFKWRGAEIGSKFEEILEKNGAKIISWGWFVGGIGSRTRLIRLPEDVKGLKMRAAGKMFEYMLAQAGATIVSMPSSEIYTALQTGVLDSAFTSVDSFYSYRLYEVIRYYTGHRKGYMIWYMLEPLIISMKTWNSLTPEQQKIVLEVGRELESWVYQQLKDNNAAMVTEFEQKGVEVHDMTYDEWKAWRDFAEKTAWKYFAETVPGGKELLDLALKVPA
ncbi:MAG: TRAP transporter substrate-binding protein DctP [Fervidicoccaceae archaeon]